MFVDDSVVSILFSSGASVVSSVAALVACLVECRSLDAQCASRRFTFCVRLLGYV